MNKKLAIGLILVTVALGIGGACYKAPPQPEVEGDEMEFVCYEDGRLSERHVMVERASNEVGSTMWHIEYADGKVSDYNQKAGESCGLEIAYGVVNVQ